MKILIRKLFIFLLFSLLFINNVFTKEKKSEITYTPYLTNGSREYSLGIALPGIPLDDEFGNLVEKISLRDCKKFLENYVLKMFELEKEQYLKSKKGNQNNYMKKPEKTKKDKIGMFYFCWPSDANLEEQYFFREYGYISPKTKYKIFPLGERKYTNEPKVKMELAEEDKK